MPELGSKIRVLVSQPILVSPPYPRGTSRAKLRSQHTSHRVERDQVPVPWDWQTRNTAGDSVAGDEQRNAKSNHTQVDELPRDDEKEIPGTTHSEQLAVRQALFDDETEQDCEINTPSPKKQGFDSIHDPNRHDRRAQQLTRQHTKPLSHRTSNLSDHRPVTPLHTLTKMHDISSRGQSNAKSQPVQGPNLRPRHKPEHHEKADAQEHDFETIKSEQWQKRKQRMMQEKSQRIGEAKAKTATKRKNPRIEEGPKKRPKTKPKQANSGEDLSVFDLESDHGSGPTSQKGKPWTENKGKIESTKQAPESKHKSTILDMGVSPTQNAPLSSEIDSVAPKQACTRLSLEAAPTLPPAPTRISDHEGPQPMQSTRFMRILQGQVDAQIYREQEIRRQDSEDSDSSASTQVIEAEEDELTVERREAIQWEDSLQPHQRDMAVALGRISRQLVRHLVDTDDAVDDLVDDYETRGAELIQSMEKAHREEYLECDQELQGKKDAMRKVLRDVEAKVLRTGKNVRTLGLRKDLGAAVRASHKAVMNDLQKIYAKT